MEPRIKERGRSMEVGQARAAQWQFYERQTNTAKQRAESRLRIVQRIEALVGAGMSKSRAVAAVAHIERLGVSTIWTWLSAIEGAQHHDRLAFLVPGYRGGGRRADIDDDLFRTLKADYLRPEQPAWAECARRVEAVAQQRGAKLPHRRTLWRRLHREYTRREIATLRGEPAIPPKARRSAPPR